MKPQIQTAKWDGLRLVLVMALAMLVGPKLQAQSVTGSGTTNKVPLWTSSSTLGDSIIGQQGNVMSVGGNVSAVNVSAGGNIALPATTSSTTGVLTIGGGPFLHGFGTANAFVGQNAGNFTMSGTNNTASGDTALFSNTFGVGNTASGANALRANTTGNLNTASGAAALFKNTTGFDNTASGADALFSNTTGADNTASGAKALFSNTTGADNSASGFQALVSSTTGYFNTASGYRALFSNTTGGANIASGLEALVSNTTGSFNIAIGDFAGASATTGDFNIYIGNVGVAAEAYTTRIGQYQNRTFVAGIYGIGTGSAPAAAVLVDSHGQLGTGSSSRRVKYDIHDMEQASNKLLRLRPVTFRYKQAENDGSHPLEYGLIAEEVAEVYPELVAYDAAGEPFTVRYHVLPAQPGGQPAACTPGGHGFPVSNTGRCAARSGGAAFEAQPGNPVPGTCILCGTD